MNGDVRFGTPSLEEWHGKWKFLDSDSDADRGEHFRAYEDLTRLLSSIGREGSGDNEDFYFRGDFTGDRTQVLEIVYPPRLTAEFVEVLQAWIRRQRQNWRILVPTYIHPRDALVIYADKTRYGAEPSVTDAVLQAVVDKMMKHKDRGYARRRYEEQTGRPW